MKHGPQTVEEMMFGFFFYTDANEDLNLNVDPETGRPARSKMAEQGESKNHEP